MYGTGRITTFYLPNVVVDEQRQQKSHHHHRRLPGACFGIVSATAATTTSDSKFHYSNSTYRMYVRVGLPIPIVIYRWLKSEFLPASSYCCHPLSVLSVALFPRNVPKGDLFLEQTAYFHISRQRIISDGICNYYHLTPTRYNKC